MEKWKQIGYRLLYPGKVLSICIILLGFGLLISLPLYGIREHPLNYASYVLSFYALILVITNSIPLVKKGIGLYGKVKAAGVFHISRTLTLSMIINIAYAVYHLVSGFVYDSAWLFSNGVYYLTLSLIRLMLVRYEKKQGKLQKETDKLLLGWKGFSLCGYLMLALNIAMSAMVVQMIRAGKESSYSDILVVTIAAYTFYRLTNAIIRVVRSGKNSNPIHGAARNISLTAAIMSLYSLQITMLQVFGDGTTDNTLINCISGAAVCVLAVLGAFGMVLHGRKRAREVVL